MDVSIFLISLVLACTAQPMLEQAEDLTTDEGTIAPSNPEATEAPIDTGTKVPTSSTGSSEPTVENISQNETTSGNTTKTPPPNLPLVYCETARDAVGACASRPLCDYGTLNVDRTLYAPKGYVKSCRDAEVCCPLDSIDFETMIENLNTTKVTNATFQFDDDD